MSRLDWTRGCCAALAALAVSCGSQPAVVKPSRAAAERVLARIGANETRTVFEVRLNPTACGAPPFEVRLGVERAGDANGQPGADGGGHAGGAWQRVFLEPDDPNGPVGALASRFETLDAAGSRPATIRVRGRLLSKVREAPNRSPYPVLTVIGECEGASCDDEAGEGDRPTEGTAP